MVGYDADDKLSMNEKLIAGLVSGSSTRFFTQPLDIVKLRTQLNKKIENPQRRWFKITRRILKEEGITAFWQGHNLGQIHTVLALGCQFYVFEQTTKFVLKSGADKKYMPIINFFCGVASGCCAAMLVVPLEVIRVRQMLHKKRYKGLLRGAREVYKNGGIFAFYEGVMAAVCQMGPAVGIAFAVFNIVQPRILGIVTDCRSCPPTHVHDARHVMLSSTIAGITAGFISKTTTYPFELVKRRMQIQTHKVPQSDASSTTKNLIRCHSFVECVKQMYRDGGIPGMFRGWKVTIYKAQLSSIVSFTTYELVCYFLRNR